MRLIDADALKKVIWNNVYLVQDVFNSRDCGMFWTGGIEKAIDEAPTIDAVQVVRCKDCKHYDGEYTYPMCWRNEIHVHSDDYCSYGENREVEE